MRVLLLRSSQAHKWEDDWMEDLNKTLTWRRHVVGAEGLTEALENPCGPNGVKEFGPDVTISLRALSDETMAKAKGSGRVIAYVHRRELDGFHPSQLRLFNRILARTRNAERELIKAGCINVCYAPWRSSQSSDRYTFELALEHALRPSWP